MKTEKKTRTRCECDFCGKRNWSPSHMTKHEKACTMNPNRICRMCDVDGNLPQPSREALVEAISVAKVIKHIDEYGHVHCHIENQKEALSRLKDITTCPACILTAIRTLGIYASAFELFRYDDEKCEMWSAVNEAAMCRAYGD